jgi:hypothetical protein
MLLGLAPLANGVDNESLKIRPPSGLSKNCSVVRRWVGIVPRMPYGLWLRCGSDEFFVTEPMSLFSHVMLSDTEAALDFVRFFSLPSSERYLRPEGMVEVVARTENDDDFNAVRPDVFRRLFHLPRVKLLPSIPTDAVNMFSIERVMLTPSGQVVDITEMIGTNGYYEIVSRRMVLRDASKAGLYYLDH